MNCISRSAVEGSAIRKLAIGLALVGAFGAVALFTLQSRGQEAQQGTAASKVGTVKSISGTTIVLKVDSGADVTIAVPEGARVLRLAPGQTSLKSATPMTLPEVQVGDRMLVRGKPGDNADSFIASSVVVMKQADVAQKQQHERDDWQKRGTGGIMSAVDTTTGTISVAITPTLSCQLKTSKDTRFLWYA